MNNKSKVIDRIILFGIYLYLFFMFLTKGEGIRNVLIFGNFALWLFTLKDRNNLHILRNSISFLFLAYLLTIPFSVIMSIDPIYSLEELKDGPLKATLLFPVLATTMSNKKRLQDIPFICLFILILIVSIGYYSYCFHNIPILKPDTALVHAWHNRFAYYLNILIPFTIILFFLRNNWIFRIILIISLLISVIALILSTSRGGYAAFFAMTIMLAICYSKLYKYNLQKIVALILIIVMVTGIVVFVFLPDTATRLKQGIYSLNNRTALWASAVYAVKKKYIVGWGYGSKLFRREEPFIGMPFEKITGRGIHNKFLSILFQQGIVGLIPYILLLCGSIVVFWGEAFKSKYTHNYILIACISVIISSFILHALVESFPKLPHLAVILGLGTAARGINEDSHN